LCSFKCFFSKSLNERKTSFEQRKKCQKISDLSGQFFDHSGQRTCLRTRVVVPIVVTLQRRRETAAAAFSNV
jgi:hypothetical protein